MASLMFSDLEMHWRLVNTHSAHISTLLSVLKPPLLNYTHNIVSLL